MADIRDTMAMTEEPSVLDKLRDFRASDGFVAFYPLVQAAIAELAEARCPLCEHEAYRRAVAHKKAAESDPAPSSIPLNRPDVLWLAEFYRKAAEAERLMGEHFWPNYYAAEYLNRLPLPQVAANNRA